MDLFVSNRVIRCWNKTSQNLPKYKAKVWKKIQTFKIAKSGLKMKRSLNNNFLLSKMGSLFLIVSASAF